MIDTDKNYQPFVFSEEDRKKLLFQELLSATIICFVALAVTLVVGVKDIFIISVDIGASIAFVIPLFLVRKHYDLAIWFYLIFSLIIVYFIIFFLPNIKFLALFILIISFNGFIYLSKYKTATLFLKTVLSIGLLTFVIESWYSYKYFYSENTVQNMWFNDYIVLLIFVATLIAKVFLVVKNYHRILEYLINQYRTAKKLQTNYKDIIQYNSLAIVVCDISHLYEFVQNLKTEQNITDIKAYLNENLSTILQLMKTIRVKSINEKGYEIRGTRNRNAFFGNNANIYNQSLKTAAYNEMIALFEGKAEFETEIDLINYQGLYRRVKYFVKYPPHKDFSNVSYTYIDITDQQKIKLELKETNERYRTLYANAPVGIIILDIDKLKRGLDCNQMLLRILKVSKYTALNGNMIVLSPEYQEDGKSTKDKLGKIMSEFRAHRKTMQFEWLFKSSDNALVWTEVTFSPIEWEGEMQSIMFIKDVTKQKRQQQLILRQLSALNEKNDELEKYIASNLELENFAYIASHDLQAPLRTVISFSNLLEKSLKGKISKSEEEYMRFIVDGTYHMRQLINDLLAFSRVNTTQNNLELIKINDTIELVLLDMKEDIEKKDAIITCDNIGFKIKADKTKLRQLIQNLVNNALKFTVEGKKTRVTIKGEESSTHWKISVQDNGIGIKKEFQEQIFLMFKRLHGQKEYTGTGIGLALCKKIVEQHKGRIKVKSEKNVGSTFSFTIAKDLE